MNQVKTAPPADTIMPDPLPRPKRRRSFVFRAAVVLVGGGVLYPLSFGPAAWLDSRLSGAGEASPAFHAAYCPFIAAAAEGSYGLNGVIWSYAGLGLPSGMVPGSMYFQDERMILHPKMVWVGDAPNGAILSSPVAARAGVVNSRGPTPDAVP